MRLSSRSTPAAGAVKGLGEFVKERGRKEEHGWRGSCLLLVMGSPAVLPDWLQGLVSGHTGLRREDGALERDPVPRKCARGPRTSSGTGATGSMLLRAVAQGPGRE